MKVRIEITGDVQDDEIVIRCVQSNDMIEEVYQSIVKMTTQKPVIQGYKRGQEFFLPSDEILFFETEAEHVYAHTADDAYRIKLRLYELETLLPDEFVRISKSSILNVEHISAINRNLTSSTLVHFYKSHKQVYVSRLYYKDLRHKMEEK